MTFADPERIVLDILEARMSSVSSSTAYPSERLAGDQVHLQVDLEGTTGGTWPVTEEAQVRVVAHVAAGRRDSVKQLASDASGWLLAEPGASTWATIRPATRRSDVTRDPDTENLMCWFLVTVVLTATPVAP